MASINLAYTGTINSAGVTPVLTQDQVWKALERKVRRGEDFVPVIEHTLVVSETKSTAESHPSYSPGTEIVVREAQFKDGAGPPLAQANNGKLQETCILLAPTRVDFLGPDGNTVNNTVSQGPGGSSDLKMTYTFSYHHPELDPVKDKVAVEHIRERYLKSAEGAVENTIKSIRKLMEAGDIGNYEVHRK